MQTLNLLIQWGGILMLAFLVLLAMPQSRLREIVMPFVGWAVCALSVGYIFSPMDLVPDFFVGIGQLDDLVVLGVAVASAMAALNAGKKKRPSAAVATERAKAKSLN